MAKRGRRHLRSAQSRRTEARATEADMPGLIFRTPRLMLRFVGHGQPHVLQSGLECKVRSDRIP